MKKKPSPVNGIGPHPHNAIKQVDGGVGMFNFDHHIDQYKQVWKELCDTPYGTTKWVALAARLRYTRIAGMARFQYAILRDRKAAGAPDKELDIIHDTFEELRWLANKYSSEAFQLEKSEDERDVLAIDLATR